MPINDTQVRPFTKDLVDKSPDAHGVYALYDGDTLIYVGRAQGKGVTIRSRLQRHRDGAEGACTAVATHYRREVREDAKEREAELLTEYKRANKGKMPRCNEVMP